MTSVDPNPEQACKVHLERFCTILGDQALTARTSKALRFLAQSDTPIRGKPEGWAAGIIYAILTSNRPACGLPGVLNSEAEQIFGVTMGTVRKLAAQVRRALEV
jgi:hypothetical protein